jgi:hypothetical protein
MNTNEYEGKGRRIVEGTYNVRKGERGRENVEERKEGRNHDGMECI